MGQSINLNLIPKGIADVVNVSQFDVGREIEFTLYDGSSKYTIPTGATVQIGGKKGDNHIFAYDQTDGCVSFDGSVVTITTTQQMTACAGDVLAQLRVIKDGVTLASLNFKMYVQAMPDAEGDISETDIPAIIALATEQEEAAAASALKAEGYAIGEQNGTPVSSGTYYHNNAKYYKEQAATSATAAAGSADHADATAADVDEAVQAVEGVVDTTYGMQDSLSIDVDGNPIEGNFAGMPADKLTVDINPIQNLHGYDKPWVGGGNKNKLWTGLSNIKSINTDGTWNDNVYSINGIAYTISTNSSGNVTKIVANGTATANATLNVNSNFDTTNYNGYIYSCLTQAGGSGKFRSAIQQNGSPYTELANDTGSGATITTPSSGTKAGRVWIAISSGRTVSNLEFYPMVRPSGTDSTFAPYSNICPIEGISELDINVKGKNLLIMPAMDTTKNTAVCSTLKDSNNNIVGYQITGTPSTWTSFVFPSNVLDNLVNGQRYKLVCKNDSSSRYLAIWDNNTNSWAAQSISRTPYFTYNSSHTYQVQFGCNAVYSDVKLYPMIIADTETDDTFVPYQKETDIDLEDTRHGATIDIKTGEMIINRVREVLDWAEGVVVSTIGDYTYKHFKTQYRAVYPPSTGRPQLCDKALYKADWTEASSHFYIDAQAPSSAYNTNIFLPTNASITDVEVCYELYSPQKVQLTPAQVEILKGYNRITANGNTVIHLSAVPEKLINYIVNAFGTDESGRTTASRAYAAKEYFYKDGFMYKVTSAIAQNAAFTEGTNCSKTTIFAELTALNA